MSKPSEQLPKPDSRGAFRRLVIVLAAVIGILIYSYGWSVTDIDLSVPQEERRQTNVTRALRELLSPNIFDQERELVTVEAPFLMDCDSGDLPAQSDLSGSEIMLEIEPACADAGDTITFTLVNASPNADARIRWQPPGAEDDEEVRPRPREVIETGREDFVLSNTGSFTGSIEVPLIRGGEGQIHQVRVLVAVPSGPIIFSDTANQVIGSMVETIFMALVATTVAIPIAAMLSFFAARNLMRRVRLSVGTMLMTVILLVGGAWLGSVATIWLGRWGLMIGSGAGLAEPLNVLVAFGVTGVVLVITIFVLGQLARNIDEKDKRGADGSAGLKVVNTVITAAAAVFLIGALGGLGDLGGDVLTRAGDALRPESIGATGSWWQNAGGDLIWSVGNFLDILGQLIELFIGVLAAAITGFALSGLGGALFGNAIRRINGSLSHVMAAVMGGIVGAMLLGGMAVLGSWAALLGILPPLIGSFMGGQVALQILRRFYRQPDAQAATSRVRQAINWGVYGAGSVIVFIFLFNQLSLGRSLVDGTLPTQDQAILFGIETGITAYLFQAMLAGAVLGTISGGLAGLQAVFPLGTTLYNTARTSLNVVRSIEPLIMGLVFVIWVGIGPFAGVLALTLHSIAALGKLYSEQIENIDPGPLEALQSTGANQLQTIIYAVLPQIIPPYIAFTMYRWDINVRMSTIIGFVGGGGIGLLLQQQINLLRYRDAGVAVLAIAVVVSILDYASASIRERVT